MIRSKERMIRVFNELLTVDVSACADAWRIMRLDNLDSIPDDPTADWWYSDAAKRAMIVFRDAMQAAAPLCDCGWKEGRMPK
jgi:hypothetical protein